MRIAVLVSQGQRNKGYDVPAEMIGAGFTADVVETGMPVFPHNQLDHTLMQVSTIEGGLRAVAAGYDAVFLNTIGDYGLAALRSAVPVPVVGAGQAGMQIAAGLGRRFAIVTIWPEALRYLYEQLVADYGFADRCAGIRFVAEDAELASLDDDSNFVTEMRAGVDPMIGRIARAMAAAVEDDGADTILLGCTCMAPIAGRLAALTDVPVINPLNAGYKLTETMLTLGLTQSPAAFRPSADRQAQFQAMVAAAAPLMPGIAVDCAPCRVVRLDAAGD